MTKRTSIFSNDDNTYLTLLQGVINRMGLNSLYCKLMCCTILPVLAGLQVLPYWVFLLCGLMLVLAMAWLDAVYLSLEKEYRGLYNNYVKIVKLGNEEAIRQNLFSLNPGKYATREKIFKAFSSWSVGLPYIIFAIFVSIVTLCRYPWIAPQNSQQLQEHTVKQMTQLPPASSSAQKVKK